MASSTTIFTGNSHFSADFQSLVARAVAIASLPKQQRQSEVQILQSQSTGLNTIGTAFADLRAAVTGLESALGASSYGSAVTDPDVAGVALVGTPLPGTFSLDVLDLGTYASSMSTDGLTTVTDPSVSNLSNATSYTVRVGGSTYTITPPLNTLSSLAHAINLDSHANVQATVVNIGSPSSPDYRLSLQGIQLGDLPLELTADNGSDPGQLLTATHTTGAQARYRVNGQPSIAISTENRVVTISPGVVVTLYGEGTTGISVNRSTSALCSAFTRFVNAYNSAQAAIDRNRGEGDGELRGQSLLITLTAGLHHLAEYTGGESGLDSLTVLGLSFDRNGVLSFDSTKFSGVTGGQIAQLASFLGSSTGGGFLKAANDTLNALAGEDGVIGQLSESLRNQIADGNDRIAEEDKRIETLRAHIEARMAAADAAIAALEQRAQYIGNMFLALAQA